MNQKNALEFGRSQGCAWQEQTPFVEKDQYLEFGTECAAYHARSEKAYNLFRQGWSEVWKEPESKPETQSKELPHLDLSDPDVITVLAHYLLQ